MRLPRIDSGHLATMQAQCENSNWIFKSLFEQQFARSTLVNEYQLDAQCIIATSQLCSGVKNEQFKGYIDVHVGIQAPISQENFFLIRSCPVRLVFTDGNTVARPDVANAIAQGRKLAIYFHLDDQTFATRQITEAFHQMDLRQVKQLSFSFWMPGKHYSMEGKFDNLPNIEDLEMVSYHPHNGGVEVFSKFKKLRTMRLQNVQAASELFSAFPKHLENFVLVNPLGWDSFSNEAAAGIASWTQLKTLVLEYLYDDQTARAIMSNLPTSIVRFELDCGIHAKPIERLNNLEDLSACVEHLEQIPSLPRSLKKLILNKSSSQIDVKSDPNSIYVRNLYERICRSALVELKIVGNQVLKLGDLWQIFNRLPESLKVLDLSGMRQYFELQFQVTPLRINTLKSIRFPYHFDLAKQRHQEVIETIFRASLWVTSVEFHPNILEDPQQLRVFLPSQITSVYLTAYPKSRLVTGV